jgi:hypothetical protein
VSALISIKCKKNLVLFIVNFRFECLKILCSKYKELNSMLGLLVWLIQVLVIRSQKLYISYEKSLSSCGGSSLSVCSGGEGSPFPDLLSALNLIDSAAEVVGTSTLILSENITYVLDPKKVIANKSYDSLRNRTFKKNIVVKGEDQQEVLRKIIWNTRLTIHVPESLLWEKIYFTSEGQHNGEIKKNFRRGVEN